MLLDASLLHGLDGELAHHTAECFDTFVSDAYSGSGSDQNPDVTAPPPQVTGVAEHVGHVLRHELLLRRPLQDAVVGGRRRVVHRCPRHHPGRAALRRLPPRCGGLRPQAVIPVDALPVSAGPEPLLLPLRRSERCAVGGPCWPGCLLRTIAERMLCRRAVPHCVWLHSRPCTTLTV